MPDIFNSLQDFQQWFDFSSVVSSEGASEVGAQGPTCRHAWRRARRCLRCFQILNEIRHGWLRLRLYVHISPCLSYKSHRAAQL